MTTRPAIPSRWCERRGDLCVDILQRSFLLLSHVTTSQSRSSVCQATYGSRGESREHFQRLVEDEFRRSLHRFTRYPAAERRQCCSPRRVSTMARSRMELGCALGRTASVSLGPPLRFLDNGICISTTSICLFVWLIHTR